MVKTYTKGAFCASAVRLEIVWIIPLAGVRAECHRVASLALLNRLASL